MPYLIDTDVIIYHLNGIVAAESLLQRLAHEGLSISAVTYMEAVDGLARGTEPLVARQRFDILLSVLSVVPFDRREAQRCADLRTALRARGKRVRPRSLDIMIAATAIEHDLTLVTNNPGDYDDIPELSLQAAQINTGL